MHPDPSAEAAKTGRRGNKRETRPGPRIAREQATITAMMRIFCRDHHGDARSPCPECSALLDYAKRRLEVCPFQEEKPACNQCSEHCYSRTMRQRIKAVMRYAGPRMILRHPLLSLYHLLDRRREMPELQPRSR